MVSTVVFDVIGTLFSLDVARARLQGTGAPPYAVDLWFAESLRDLFGVSHSGAYIPLAQVLEESLPRALRVFDIKADEDTISSIMGSLKELDPAPGAHETCERFEAAGWRLVALTNGSQATARTLLERSGLLPRFSNVLSCDAIGVSKPHAGVYGAARAEAGANDLWMVTAHGWDVYGAARAGLHTAWISSKEGHYPSVYPPPDVQAPDLSSAAMQILDLLR